jgi:Lon protease-like protein
MPENAQKFAELVFESNNSIMQQELLPLFPLQVVVFPRTPIALHIFEERYKEMVGEAIERNAEFGIVLASEKGIVNSGCTAVVDRVVQKYPDGRMDIIAAGRRRFELLELNDDLAYLRGAVEFFDDEDDGTPVPESLRDEAVARYQELIKLEGQSALLDPELFDTQLSFQLAQGISDVTMRQLLLVCRSEAERIQQIATYLPTLLRQRRELAQAQQVASTNGHGKRPSGL